MHGGEQVSSGVQLSARLHEAMQQLTGDPALQQYVHWQAWEAGNMKVTNAWCYQDFSSPHA
jgi:hypothetical protein